MAMLDKIWQGTGNIPSEPTKFLPSNFFAPIMPVSLEVDDIFSLKGSVLTGDEFHPIRSFFLDELNAYLIFDIGTPTMVAIYLIDNETKEMLASYIYMVESCPIHKKYDQFIDCCVHHDDMSKDVQVSFLIANDVVRSVTIARFKLQIDHIREPFVDAGSTAYYIQMDDLQFFADIVAPGAKDEIALPFSWDTVTSFGGSATTYRYPKFDTTKVIKRLRETFHIGTINTKYCSLTVDEAGHYIVLLGSRLVCHLGPNLEFPLDTQYVVLLDQGGFNQRFVLIGPYANFMCWDETEEHQPTKFNATVFDGRYILCLEDRKSRYIAPRRIFASGVESEPDGRSYTESTMSWRGGEVADVYYPPQQASASYPQRQNYTEIGYPSVWDEQSTLEPVHREYIWTLIDICDLLAKDTTPTIAPPPYSADVVFLVDVSGSMGGNIAQIQANIGTFANTLSSLKVTDFRVGIAAYTSVQTPILSPQGAMWASNTADAIALASSLKLGVVPSDSAMHNAGLAYVANAYKFRAAASTPKYVVLVTDTGDESDTVSRAQAVAAMAGLGIKVCVVSNTQNIAFFSSLTGPTGGIFYDITGAWGPRVSNDLATRIAEEADTSDQPAWWDRVADAWTPRVLYNFNPVMGAEYNSLVTIFHDAVSYVSEGHVIKNKVNFLVVYDSYPVDGGMPQNSIYIPGIVPGETVSQSVIIKNESMTGTMKSLAIELVDLPPDVTVNLTNFPEKLEPQEMAVITVAVSYSPTSSPVARHIDASYKVTYWMQHVLSCGDASGRLLEVPPVVSDDLYFVSDTSVATYIPGLEKEIAMAPLFTDAYVTTTEYIEGDVAKASNMNNANVYVVTLEQQESVNYEKITAGPLSALAGNSVAETGYVWLRITGPIDWHTTRSHDIDTNTITWWMVNRSSDASFIAHVHMNNDEIVVLNEEMKGMGFLLIDYPDGNIIPPGESRPVTFKWRPIFNPDGEQMTLAKSYYDIKTGFPQSAWSTDDAMFSNLIYVYPNVVPDFQFAHIWEETVAGDGLDMTIPKDYPLKKFDTKLIAPYAVNTELTVDTSTVVEGFPFVQPDQILGVKEGDPATEKTSPDTEAGFLPTYIDHKFKANPDYLYHAEADQPFQLAPFNKQYAVDYVATAFYGNVILKSETLPNTKFTDMTKYDDEGSDLIPCDVDGNELAGWLFENFWPGPDAETSIQELATENEIVFVREVYVKNKGTSTTPVLLNVGPSMIQGLSLQGVDVATPNPLPPDTVVKLTLTLRFHYSYSEAGYVNMVKQLLLIPRFNVPLSA